MMADQKELAQKKRSTTYVLRDGKK